MLNEYENIAGYECVCSDPECPVRRAQALVQALQTGEWTPRCSETALFVIDELFGHLRMYMQGYDEILSAYMRSETELQAQKAAWGGLIVLARPGPSVN